MEKLETPKARERFGVAACFGSETFAAGAEERAWLGAHAHSRGAGLVSM